MKSTNHSSPGQRGIVLFTVLIALVVLSLASVALMRSIDTGTVIAGNLAFRQAATQAGDAGTESALAWIQAEIASKGATSLYTSKAAGYYANARVGCDPSGRTPGAADDVRWTSSAPANPDCNMVATAVDAAGLPAGYTASYVINRMCTIDGPPGGTAAGGSTVQCDFYTRTTASAEQGRSMTTVGYHSTSAQASAYFFRVTTRVEGPNNTVSYVQTVLLN